MKKKSVFCICLQLITLKTNFNKRRLLQRDFQVDILANFLSVILKSYWDATRKRFIFGYFYILLAFVWKAPVSLLLQLTVPICLRSDLEILE